MFNTLNGSSIITVMLKVKKLTDVVHINWCPVNIAVTFLVVLIVTFTM